MRFVWSMLISAALMVRRVVVRSHLFRLVGCSSGPRPIGCEIRAGVVGGCKRKLVQGKRDWCCRRNLARCCVIFRGRAGGFLGPLGVGAAGERGLAVCELGRDCGTVMFVLGAEDS